MSKKITTADIKGMGLETCRRKRNSKWVVFVRDPIAKEKHQRCWWILDEDMKKAMEKYGILDGFFSVTAYGDFFQ